MFGFIEQVLRSLSSFRIRQIFSKACDATDRRSQAVAELMGEGQLDMSRWQELSVVLNSDQACVQGGGPAVTQHGRL